MTFSENTPEEIQQANELIEGALAMEPQDLLNFQSEFSKDNKRNAAATGAAIMAINRQYPDLKATDPDTYVLFCGQKAIHEYGHVNEVVENGTIFGHPVDSLQTLAYYRSGFETYLNTGKEATE